ncbi:uncharacterized protein LOC113388380 [Ctenocephalides felis]|nr:uncharacterized protein LOC113388380 [Ctenocephalides felis]
MADFTALLIAKVRSNELLYDMEHPQYKNAKLKEAIYEDIGKQLNTTGEDIKKKWKNLRDTYTKHLRSQAGHLAAKNYKNWPWAKHMDFVKPFQSSVNNAANNAQKEKDAKTMKCESMESAEEHAATFDELQLPEFDEEQLPCYLPNEQPVEVELHEAKTPCGSDIPNYFKRNATHRCIENLDGTEHIFLGYAKLLKNFSARRQATVKMKIAKLMLDEELAHLDELAASSDRFKDDIYQMKINHNNS